LTLNVDLLTAHDVQDVERLASASELSTVTRNKRVSIFDVTKFA
jgi:hypothetical protein